MSRTAWRALGLRRASARQRPCGRRSSRPPAPDIHRVSRHLPRLVPGPTRSAVQRRAPLRAAAIKARASLLLAEFLVTSVAGVGDRRVGGSDRCLVAGFNRWHEVRSRGLHCRDQLIDVIAGRENFWFDLAAVYIRTGRKEAPVEGRCERRDGFGCSDGVRTVGGGALHDATDTEIKRPAHVLHRIFTVLERRLAVVERRTTDRPCQ